MDIKNLRKLVVSSAARKEYRNEKLYDKLVELRQMSDKKLLVERSKLEADQSISKIFLTGVVFVLFISIMGILVTTIIHYAKKYLVLLQNISKYSVNEVIALKTLIYITIGISTIVLLSLIVVLVLFTRWQRNKKILLSLYNFEESRRKSEG